MTPHAVLDRRRREREQRIDVARKYGEALSRRVPVRHVIVFGSVARGDFNAWSDIDVLVLAEELPAGGRDRLALLHDPAFLGVQPVGWTPDEFDARVLAGDPMAIEAHHVGVVVFGTRPT